MSCLKFTVGPGKLAVREARLRVRAFTDLPPQTETDAELVVSELVANSVLHARLGPEDRIDVTLCARDGNLSITVDDHGDFSGPGPRKGGLGCRVLDALCRGWTARDGCVSATLPIAGRTSQPLRR